MSCPKVIKVVTPGPTGPAGPAGVAFVHVQSVASAIWTINHNMGYRPSTELTDPGFREMDGDVLHPTVNQTVVKFNVPVTGTARLV